MQVEFTKAPKKADIDFLTQKINEETPEFDPAYCFAFFIRNKIGKIIAGCNGSIVAGDIYTDQLWVHPDYRQEGLGRKLMERVHNYGREAGCTMATIATMSYQKAIKFYEKLGYKIDFERKGYQNDSSCLFLRKEL